MWLHLLLPLALELLLLRQLLLLGLVLLLGLLLQLLRRCRRSRRRLGSLLERGGPW